jgi:hypothetical protein
MPVARNVWQPIASAMPAAGRQADHAPGVRLAHRLIGKSAAVVPPGGPEQPALSLLGEAGRGYIGAQRAWWHGIVCCLPPFSCSRIVQPALRCRGRRSSTLIFKAALIRAKR